jgi:hypothetical protein
MRLNARCIRMLNMLWLVVVCAAAESYPAVKSAQQTFEVPDVSKANVVLEIKSTAGSPLYKLQCHSAGFTGDSGFDYSGDFECRLSSIGRRDTYSTLLTEDSDQSRDWESRGRFFAVNLRNSCARVPQFGASRSFELRGMNLALQITDPVLTNDGKLHSLKLTVKVGPNPNARRPIAKIVPLPKIGVPAECKLSEYFVDPTTFSKSR